jgi:hypothetical protein
MSWIQDNKVPAAILGLTGAGVVGLGVMLFNAWSGASGAQEEFDMANSSLARLKGAALAPTPENLAQKQKLVQDYTGEVGKLSLVLYKLQPEDKPTSNTEFQAKLKARIAEIKKAGGGRLPAEFNLAFDQYTSELPKSDQVAAELSTYLDSVEEITRLLLKSGVKSVDQLERSLLASEKNEADKQPRQAAKAKDKGASKGPGQAAPATINITERRQVRVVVRADQAALQTLLSSLASPSEMPFFTVARLVRIENEAQIGPPRVASGGSLDAPPDAAAAAPVDGAEPAAADAKPTTPGIQPAAPDSHVVLGRETLRAFIEIDLVKFLNPQASAAASR